MTGAPQGGSPLAKAYDEAGANATARTAATHIAYSMVFMCTSYSNMDMSMPAAAGEPMEPARHAAMACMSR